MNYSVFTIRKEGSGISEMRFGFSEQQSLKEMKDRRDDYAFMRLTSASMNKTLVNLKYSHLYPLK